MGDAIGDGADQHPAIGVPDEHELVVGAGGGAQHVLDVALEVDQALEPVRPEPGRGDGDSAVSGLVEALDERRVPPGAVAGTRTNVVTTGAPSGRPLAGGASGRASNVTRIRVILRS